MVARDRSYAPTYLPQGGRAERVTLGVHSIDYYQYPTKQKNTGRCEDVIDGTRDPHALIITKMKQEWTPLNGKYQPIPTTNSWRRYTNYIPDYYANTIFGHQSLPSAPSTGSLVSELMARTNPGRADVNVPLMVFELKDLVPAIRSAGQRILQHSNQRRRPWRPPSGLSEGARSLADGYLAYNFAIAPLISDLGKLMQFSDSVNKRIEELQRLSREGLRRRRHLKTDTVTTNGTRTIESRLSLPVRARYDVTTKRTIWGTVRYRPSGSYHRMTRTEVQRLAYRLVTNTGNGLSASDLWNALPWSWLIDYFLEVDVFLRSIEYKIPAHAYNACIMTYTETLHSYTRDSDGQVFTGGGGYCLLQTKQRALSANTLNFSLPFLNGRQMSNLGALAVSRNRGRLAT